MVEFLEQESSSRVKVLFIISATFIPPSEAFVREISPFGGEDPKLLVNEDDT